MFPYTSYAAAHRDRRGRFSPRVSRLPEPNVELRSAESAAPDDLTSQGRVRANHGAPAQESAGNLRMDDGASGWGQQLGTEARDLSTARLRARDYARLHLQLGCTGSDPFEVFAAMTEADNGPYVDDSHGGAETLVRWSGQSATAFGIRYSIFGIGWELPPMPARRRGN